MKIIAIVLIIASLAGCSAKGVRFKDDLSVMAPIELGKARAVVFRSFDNGLYKGRAASIEVDKQPVEGCLYGGYSTFDMQSGYHTFRADMWDMPGSCTVASNLNDGETKYFEVRPISSSFWLGGPISGSIRAAIVECAGAFSVEEVQKTYALEKLTTLRKNTEPTPIK